MTAPPPAPEPSGVGRASALLASGTLVSRLLGFVSVLVLAQTLGIKGAGANTFAVANQLPNNVYAIVAGGVLSAVLVPQIVRAGLHSDGGQKFINRIVTLGAVVFIAAAAIATVCAPLLVRLYARQGTTPGSSGYTGADIALATAFAYWCLPQILFYALYSLLGEVLNARKIFGPFTWAPVVNNVVAIAGLLLFNVMFGSRAVGDASAWTPGMIALIAGSATLGVAAQALVLVFFWRRSGLSYRPEFRWRGVGLGKVGKAAGWTFGMIIVSQLAGIVQSSVATSAGTDETSSAVLRYAWLIFMLPHSIVTVSIATAYFTRMSGHARDSDTESLKRDISASLRTIGLIMVLATVTLIVVAYPFSALFSKNGFEETRAMGNVLIAFLPGLIPFTILFVLQRTFYALEDTRTPFFIQLAQSGLFVIGALLVSQLPDDSIALGIAAVTTIAGTAQSLIAALLLRRRLNGLGGRHIVRQYLIYLLASVPAAIAGLALTNALGSFTGGFAVSGLAAAVATMAVVGVVMVIIYVVVLAALGTPELRAMLRPVVMRLRGRS
ncbi:MAG: putative peptidoglycan lipid flippase MurJ [Glaciihabitans sp.]|nr:putative peptidoglycan lipid flippase MurJ [Glaciihabitans sp.]